MGLASGVAFERNWVILVSASPALSSGRMTQPRDWVILVTASPAASYLV